MSKKTKASIVEETVIEEIAIEEPAKKYSVVHSFKDLDDGDKVYIKGNSYPRPANKKVTDERIKELSSTKNKLKKQLIKEQK